MRKEGHAKIIQYSLTPKQQVQDDMMGIKRSNILLAASSTSKAAKTKANGTGAKGKARRKERNTDTATARELRHDSGDESSEGYNQEEVDSDQDSLDPDPPNGREASPASTTDEESDDNGGEAAEDEALEDNRAMELDGDEQEELEADLAGVEGGIGADSRPKTASALSGGSGGKQTERIMTAQECRAHLRLVFKNESQVCSLVYGSHGPLATRRLANDIALTERLGAASGAAAATTVSADMFFVEVVCVPPSRFRPPATMGDMTFESPQNELMSAVVRPSRLCHSLRLSLTRAD